MRDITVVDTYQLTAAIKVEKRIHPVWTDWIMMKEKGVLKGMPHENTPILGQYQYLYTSRWGKKISLVELPNYFLDGIDLWEAMEFKSDGDLTHDEKRFRSKEEAEEWIKRVLD